MKIVVGVGGRFHSHQIVDALLSRHWDVQLVTSLPSWKFNSIPRTKLISFILPEIGFRILSFLGYPEQGDRFKIKSFGKKLGQWISRLNDVDIFMGWSSFSKEAFQATSAPTKILVRTSCHISFQENVLKEEFQRLNYPFPNRDYVTERECWEYEHANYILVNSIFSQKTFIDQGVSPNKLKVITTGVDSRVFFPPPHFEQDGPLNVLFFGNISARKGIHYLLEATSRFKPADLRLYLVGPISPEIRETLRSYHHATLIPPLDRTSLNSLMKKMHVYVLPSVEEGFANTLIEAMAAGLVPIATPNTGSAQLIQEGQNGFVIPIRSPQAIRERLEYFLSNREQLQSMRYQASLVSSLRPWEKHNEELLSWIDQLIV